MVKSEHPPLTILEDFCRAARDVIGASRAGLGIVAEDGTLRQFCCNSAGAETFATESCAAGLSGALQVLVRERRPLRWGRLSDSQAPGVPPSWPGGVRSWLGAPLVASTEVYGWVCLVNKLGADAFSDEDERIVTAFAGPMASAYESAVRAAEMKRRAAELEEELTERERAERVLRESEQRLIKVLREIGERKKLEEQLRQSQKMEVVGRLAGGLAHDFNNLLTVILGYAGLARERIGPARPGGAEIEQLEKAATRAAALTGQLLAFSRKQAREPHLLDLNERVGVPAEARDTKSLPAELPRGSETILLVEDEPAVRTLARTVLAGRGYRVLEAAGGSDALAIAELSGDPIHLLITDVVMPRMSGSELAQRLAAERPEMRVFYLSGYSEHTFGHRGKLPGSVFLRKPFTPDRLLHKVREVLDRGPVHRERIHDKPVMPAEGIGGPGRETERFNGRAR